LESELGSGHGKREGKFSDRGGNGRWFEVWESFRRLFDRTKAFLWGRWIKSHHGNRGRLWKGKCGSKLLGAW